VQSSVIGGAMLPHAPQFFTMPETEDRATVERVKTVAKEIGGRLKALKPDLWLIFANDHAEQYFHNVAPPFTVHVGASASGHFAGRDFHWEVPGEIGFEIVKGLYRQGFDPAFTSTAKIDYAMGIPLTHLGVEDPVLPISVNAYLPPQPTIERCYAFGEAVARVVTSLGLRTAVIASGGMSHYPGTERYAEPDLAWDEAALARLATGNLKSLIGYSEEELDRAGNIELRCWAAAAGMLGERTPDIVSMSPSWHHNYASLGLIEAVHGLAHDTDWRANYLADRVAYAARFDLTTEQHAAFVALDHDAIVAMGRHPLLPFLARMQVSRAGRS
jgi:2,3-dihydroxyphenylpropionate 1,2-dioxygenase